MPNPTNADLVALLEYCYAHLTWIRGERGSENDNRCTEVENFLTALRSGAVVLVPKDGMRQTYAAAALTGLCANPAIHASNDRCGWALVNCTEADLTGYAFVLADAMLAAAKGK